MVCPNTHCTLSGKTPDGSYPGTWDPQILGSGMLLDLMLMDLGGPGFGNVQNWTNQESDQPRIWSCPELDNPRSDRSDLMGSETPRGQTPDDPIWDPIMDHARTIIRTRGHHPLQDKR